MDKLQKLVIIDDEEDLLELMEYHFEREGFEVHAFDRARPAWDFIVENRPDMILCDWMMPELSGIDFCSKIKNNLQYADIPFVMVTCRSDTGAKQRAFAEGANAFIKKPIRLPELVRQVSHLISSYPGQA